MPEVVVIELPEMAPELRVRMDAICEEAYAALRADVGTVVDLAKAARAAWKRETARPRGRRRIVIQRVPRAPEAPVVKVRRSTAKTARRSGLARTWTQRRTRTDEQRARASALRAAQRARMTDAEREARNRLLTERRHAADAALTADQLHAKRAARRERDRAREAALSPEEREHRAAADRERRREKYAAMSPEQAAARKARQSATYQRRKGAAK